MLWVLIRIPPQGTQWGISNKYPQHMFSGRNKKDSIFWFKKKNKTNLFWSYETYVMENSVKMHQFVCLF